MAGRRTDQAGKHGLPPEGWISGYPNKALGLSIGRTRRGCRRAQRTSDRPARAGLPSRQPQSSPFIPSSGRRGDARPHCQHRRRSPGLRGNRVKVRPPAHYPGHHRSSRPAVRHTPSRPLNDDPPPSSKRQSPSAPIGSSFLGVPCEGAARTRPAPNPRRPVPYLRTRGVARPHGTSMFGRARDGRVRCAAGSRSGVSAEAALAVGRRSRTARQNQPRAVRVRIDQRLPGGFGLAPTATQPA
jgi:hypothetical protein